MGILANLLQILLKFFEIVISWVIWLFQKIQAEGQAVVNSLVQTAAAAFPSLHWESIGGILNQINYVFPLGECLAMSAALFAIWVSCVAYRLFKSWLPLVSGS